MLKHDRIRMFFICVVIIVGVCRYFYPISNWLFIMVAFVWLGIVIYGSAYIGSGYHIDAFCSNPDVKGKIAALTFDDGPAPETLKILDILKTYDVKAAFFCIGRQMEKYPEILSRVTAEGHTIGNHSFSHSPYFDWLGKDRVIDEIRNADSFIENATGKKSLFFRPPYGVTNPSIRRAIEATGHRVIGWNIRSMDGISKNRGYILDRILKRLRPGAIILLHDNREQTASLLEQLLQESVGRGFQFVTVESLIKETHES